MSQQMDVHIQMSYITPPGFIILNSNYLSIDKHHLFGEKEQTQESQTTTAEVTQELMKSDEADVFP